MSTDTSERGLERLICTTLARHPCEPPAAATVGEQRGRNFAIIIDEAHSSQGGKTSGAMAQALSEAGAEVEDDPRTGSRGCGLQERPVAFRQGKCPHRTRQGPAARRDFDHERR